MTQQTIDQVKGQVRELLGDSSPYVSHDVALALRDAGYPQEMRVGDYGYHLMAALVRCTKVRKRDPNVQPIDNPVVKAPTKVEALAWMQERGLVLAHESRVA